MDYMKPCPFCGELNLSIAYVGQPAISWHVYCLTCGARGPKVGTASPSGGAAAGDVGAVWNQRAPTPQVATEER
jgi:Lar family restriction alleviation protein